MKINIFMSAVKAISRWLHGEGSKDFRTYTWPRIKSGTRKYIDLGLYERIERVYKIVDDTFYNGAVEMDPTDPLEIARLEQFAEMQESGSANLADSVNTSTLPKFSQIKPNLFIWKGLEQGRTYRCGTYTMNNMLRSQMLKQGLQPSMEVTAIDPLYIATKYGRGKTGTVMSQAFNYLAEKGFPMPSWGPLMEDHNTELAKLESSQTIGNADKFAGIKTTGKVIQTTDFEQAVEFDRTLPSNYEIQVSISFCASLKYFGQLVPFVEPVNGKFSFVRTGGHSVHGVRNSFSSWQDGEAGMAIIESAYRSREDGLRFLKRKLFDYGLIRIRFVEFNLSGESVAPSPTVPPQSDSVLGTATISFGQTGSAVKTLQEYLIASGFSIPAGATAYFGEQTRRALQGWQDKHFGTKYNGRQWGPLSRQKYRQLIR